MDREEAIDLLDNLIGFVEDNHDSDYDKALKMAIEALKQKRKKAKWIEGFDDLTCSRCGERLYAEQMYIHKNFCPNCGAKMAESEDKE